MRGSRPMRSQKLPRGMRQFSVLAGSEVRLRLDSDRPLKAAEVNAGEQELLARCNARMPSPNGEEVWTLAAAGTPLASVAEELSYSIQVHDAEGQPWISRWKVHHHRARPAAGHHGQRP